MIGIDDDKWIFQAHLFILINGIHQIVIVVVRNIFPVFVQCSAKNGVGQWIPRCFHLFTEEKETLFILRCINPVKHDIEISRCGIFKSC